MKKFWPCCRKPETTPQNFEPPEEKEEPEPCHIAEEEKAPVNDLEKYRAPQHWVELSIVCMESSSTGSNTEVSTSFLGSSICTLPLNQSEQNYAETIISIMERVKNGDKSFMDNSEQKIDFLHAISAACQAAHKSGSDTLGLPYSKDELADAIVMVMDTLPIHSLPPTILTWSMLAIYKCGSQED